MHQYFILVLVSIILTALKYSLKPQMKIVILCMIALFLLVIRSVCHKMFKYMLFMSAKLQRVWDGIYLLLKEGFGGCPPTENIW